VIFDQRQLDLAAAASVTEGIRQGREDVANGRTRPAAQVFEELRNKYKIPRETSTTTLSATRRKPGCNK